MLGTAMIVGISHAPPQDLSGLAVELFPGVMNMQSDMNRSPKTLAYDVMTSAIKMSPNFPSSTCASPPMLMRRRTARVRYRPGRENICKGIAKVATRINILRLGKTSHCSAAR